MIQALRDTLANGKPPSLPTHPELEILQNVDPLCFLATMLIKMEPDNLRPNPARPPPPPVKVKRFYDDKSQWLKHKEEEGDRGNILGHHEYMTNENGVWIGDATTKEVKTTFKAVCYTAYAFYLEPKDWSHKTDVFWGYVQSRMVYKFPFLGEEYSAHCWKLNYLGTLLYPECTRKKGSLFQNATRKFTTLHSMNDTLIHSL